MSFCWRVTIHILDLPITRIILRYIGWRINKNVLKNKQFGGLHKRDKREAITDKMVEKERTKKEKEKKGVCVDES